MMTIASGALEPLVPARSRQRTVPPDEIARAAEVAPPQGELNQFAHLHREDGFGNRCHAPTFGRGVAPGN